MVEMDSRRDPQGRMRIRGPGARFLLVVSLVVVGGACDQKQEAFFRTVTGIVEDQDVTPPLFVNPLPVCTNPVINGDTFTIEVIDPTVGGVPASGVDVAGISAELGDGTPVPTTISGALITVNVSGIPDGPVSVTVIAQDLAGNQSVHIWDKVLDRQGPAMSFVNQPPGTITIDTPTVTFGWGVSVDDPNLDAGQFGAYSPGPDGTCGTGDDTAWPQGVGPGLVNPQRMDFTTSGTHLISQSFGNPAVGASVAVAYCWIAHASDVAVGRDNLPSPNESSIFATTLVLYQAP
jgi:hypothetical protein